MPVNENELCIWKPIAIPLYGFNYIHSPYNENVSDALYLFAGRDAIRDRLVSLIQSTTCSRGSYLIAGYRGVGKTSLVNRAIEKYKIENVSRPSRNPIVIRINLGDNSKLTPFDIYFSIANFLVEEIPNIDVCYAVKKMLEDLLERMGYEISESRSIGSEISATAQAFFKITGGVSRNKKLLPMTVRDAEERLLKILKTLTQATKRKVIFIFDEIDKLSHAEMVNDFLYDENCAGQITRQSREDKNTRINTLLGSLKNFITTAEAIFFFISGRETLDRYYSEKGSTNSLYESLFDQVFEVPSLLTDKRNPQRDFQLTLIVEEYLCRRLLKRKEEEQTLGRRVVNYFTRYKKEKNEKKEKYDDYYTLKNYHKVFLADAENNNANGRLLSNILRNFVYYLTFHSWGNPKRISVIFESFITPDYPDKDETTILKYGDDNAEYWLYFDINQLRAFALAAELTTLFQHQFSREVSRISDKLTVTSLSSLQYILKHHSYGFSRETLHHMSEAMNVHRSPAFNAIVDDLLAQTFKSYIRRVRNGVYRYRFHSGFEQELRYISHTAELDSAAYTFSLDSMRQVKQLFKNILANISEKENGIIWRSHVSLGDICALEQSFNEASTHYCAAIRLLNKEVDSHKNNISLEVLMSYIEVMMKYGDLYEHIQKYTNASAIYSDAKCVIEKILKKDNEYIKGLLQKGDSKWDMLKQPIWAINYLSLKRSPRKSCNINDFSELYRPDDPRLHFRFATLAFFLGDFSSAKQGYEDAEVNAANNRGDLPLYERSAYLEGNAIVGQVETDLTSKSEELFKKELKNKDAEPGYRKALSDILNAQFIDSDNEAKADVVVSEESILGRLEKAADLFKDSRIYISAAFTYTKAIAYLCAILDAFDNKSSAELQGFLAHFEKKVADIGKEAIWCINKARQLETSQSNKTLLVYNFTDTDYAADTKNDNQQITQLFDKLLDWSQPLSDTLRNEQVYWQQSLWAHKLAAILVWARFVHSKVKGNNEKEEDVPSCIPPETSMLSVRPSVILRWLYARDECRLRIDGKLLKKKESFKGSERIVSCHRPIEVFDNSMRDLEKYELTGDGAEFTDYVINFTQNKKITQADIPVIIKTAYLVSRNLYFALSSIRIISRRNMDLIFPRLSQIFFTQWKLLSNLSAALMLDKDINENKMGIKINSIRSVSFLLQMVFHEVDKQMATHEGIPPSHFDYEYIYTRLSESLDSSVSMADNTSRARTGIFQNKYYCHEDYTDAEFRMDYTLAYMFMPSAVYLREYVQKAHESMDVAIRTKRQGW